MAQAVFQHLVKQEAVEAHFGRIEVSRLRRADLLVRFEPSLRQYEWQRAACIHFRQSCGTGGYHVGDEPDDRTVAKCQEKVGSS